MSDILQIADGALKPSVVAFMVGNLLAIGLETDVKAALAPLGDVRFVVTATLLDWLFCPALAWLITRLLPIAQPYAVGLLLIGLAPAAPFLPMMVRRAGGDMAYTAAFMLVAAIGTVLLMPLAVPLIVPGLSVDPWTVAKPLVALLFLPMAAGIAVKTVAPFLAARMLRHRAASSERGDHPVVGSDRRALFRRLRGSHRQLRHRRPADLCRRTGAGRPCLGRRHASRPAQRAQPRRVHAQPWRRPAPLLVTPPDPRTMVMVALGVPITLGVTYFAAGWLSKRARQEHP